MLAVGARIEPDAKHCHGGTSAQGALPRHLDPKVRMSNIGSLVILRTLRSGACVLGPMRIAHAQKFDDVLGTDCRAGYEPFLLF